MMQPVIEKKETFFESDLSREVKKALDDIFQSEYLEEYILFLESKIYVEESPYQIYSYYISLAALLLFIYISVQIEMEFNDKLNWLDDFILRIKAVKLILTFANIPPPEISHFT